MKFSSSAWYGVALSVGHQFEQPALVALRTLPEMTCRVMLGPDQATERLSSPPASLLQAST